jgi:plastocyanin
MTPSIELTTPQILQIAAVCEYLTVVDSHTKQVFKGGDINQRQARLIYIVRKSVLNRYTLNPADPTLIATGNYLFSLLRNWPAAQNILNAIAGGLPAITNPANVAILVGANAVFTVAVTSSSPYTVQWYRNGAVIAGATSLSYTLSDAQLTDSGATFSAVATNSAGNVSSLPATLTVTAGEVGFYYQGGTDYSAALLAGNDTVSYQGTFPITAGNPFTVTFPTPGALLNIVVKYPATEPTKVLASNPPGGIDNIVIPSIALNTTVIGAWKYIFSRTGNPFGLNNVNGQVAFS